MNEAYIDTIHRYLNNDMDASERDAFEVELRQNPELQQDVELESLLWEGIDRAGEMELRQSVGAVHQQLKTSGFFEAAGAQPGFSVWRSTVGKRIMALAAVFGLLLAGIWFFRRMQSGPDTEALFVRYYQPKAEVARAHRYIEEQASFGMAAPQTATDTLLQALRVYEAGQYAEAQILLKQIVERYPDDYAIARYYLGIVYLSQGKPNQTIDALLPLARSADPLRSDARWTLALCYLKTKTHLNDARTLLGELARDTRFAKQREAKALLEKMR